jgi:hypothetical protein
MNIGPITNPTAGGERGAKTAQSAYWSYRDTIRTKILIGVQVAGTVIWNRGPGSTRPKNCGFVSGLGTKPTNKDRVALLGDSWPGPGPVGRV